MSKAPVDGYHKESNTIYEFLGDIYHGHPRLWEEDTMNIDHEKSFKKTHFKFQILHENGYKVIYIWESEFYQWDKSGGLSSLLSVCHEYNGETLEYHH
jgi:hypothetical protein